MADNDSLLNLKQLMAEAVKRVEQSGWANTDGLAVGQGRGYYARYLRLAGASAGLLIDYEAVKQMPDRPLWLWFYGDPADSVSVEEIRNALGSKAGIGLESYPGVCVPIGLPEGVDRSATLEAIVAELECIAEIIDPSGPTYGEGGAAAVAERPTSRPAPKSAVSSPGDERTEIKVVSWNIAKMHEPWRELIEMDADVALLQEVGTIPDYVLDRVELSSLATTTPPTNIGY